MNRSTSIRFGLACAAGGLIAGLLLTLNKPDMVFFIPAAALAGLVCGFSVWQLVIVRPNRISTLRSSMSGLLTALLSVYICWYIVLIMQNICYHGLGGCVDSLNEGPVDLLNGLWAAGVFSMVSLFFTGIVVLPLGALLGYLFGRRYGH